MRRIPPFGAACLRCSARSSRSSGGQPCSGRSGGSCEGETAPGLGACSDKVSGSYFVAAHDISIRERGCVPSGPPSWRGHLPPPPLAPTLLAARPSPAATMPPTSTLDPSIAPVEHEGPGSGAAAGVAGAEAAMPQQAEGQHHTEHGVAVDLASGTAAGIAQLLVGEPGCTALLQQTGLPTLHRHATCVPCIPLCRPPV